MQDPSLHIIYHCLLLLNYLFRYERSREVYLSHSIICNFITYFYTSLLASLYILINFICRCATRRLTLWGGCVDSIRIHPDPKTEGLLPWVAFKLSGPDLETKTVILDEWCRTSEQIIRRFQESRKHISLQKHSLVFMFSTHFRCKLKAIEIKAFRHVFVNVPLISVFGSNQSDSAYGVTSRGECFYTFLFL